MASGDPTDLRSRHRGERADRGPDEREVDGQPQRGRRANDKGPAKAKPLPSREAAVVVAESAVRIRERAARDRETANATREEAAHLREEAVRLREEAALLRAERQARDGELRAVNEQLVIATMHAREMQAAAEAAQQRQNEFLAILAHELRGPLAPMRSATAALRRLAADPPQLVQAHGILDRQIGQMAHLLDDLLDASRIASGKVELRRRPVTLADFVGQAVEMCRPLIESRGQSLSIALPPEPVQVDGDPVRLAQVFGNLLHNAAKYTQASGAIALTAQAHGDVVVLRVTDNGSGIAPAQLPRLFELFTQGLHSIDRSAGGLGIGLAVVHEMVTRHGGTIEVTSDGPGRGSEFIVTLPRLEPRASEREAAPERRTPAASRTNR